MSIKKFLTVFVVVAAGFSLAALLVMTGCHTIPMKEGGTLTINIDDGVKAQNIVPDIDMTTATYSIHGDGPDGKTFDVPDAVGSVTVDFLAPGSWSVIVVAKNPIGVAIGEGTGSADIVIGQTTVLPIIVLEYTGNGTLILNLDWLPEEINTPVIDANLKDHAGTVTDLTVTVDELAGTGTYSGDHEHGFYALITRLLDDTVPVGGIATIARIVAGHTSTGTYTIAINKATGELEVDIDNQIFDFLNLLADVDEGDILVYVDDPTVTINISDGEGGTLGLIEWFLNGEQAQVGGEAFIIDELDFTIGLHYRLDVLAWNIDGSRAGSLSWNIIKYVEALSNEPINLSYDGDLIFDGGDLAGYTIEAMSGQMSLPSYFPVQHSSTDLTDVFLPEDYATGIGNFIIPGDTAWVTYWSAVIGDIFLNGYNATFTVTSVSEPSLSITYVYVAP